MVMGRVTTIGPVAERGTGAGVALLKAGADDGGAGKVGSGDDGAGVALHHVSRPLKV